MFRATQIFTLTMILLVFWSTSQAAEVSAKLDRSSAVVGETITLTLQTGDTDQSLDTDLSGLESDFDVLDRRSETQMSFVNGRKTAYVRLVVTLEPKRAGNLSIPALTFPGATSEPLTLKVSAAPSLAPGDPEPVFVEVTVLPDTGPYYVLSQVGLMVRIFYQANLTEAAINPPAPTQASVRLLDEVPYQADRNGVKYRVLERRYAIFPERSGTLTIPPISRYSEESAFLSGNAKADFPGGPLEAVSSRGKDDACLADHFADRCHRGSGVDSPELSGQLSTHEGRYQYRHRR